MQLHLLGLPHTVTHERFSHDAFTGKVLRFSPMLRNVGYDVIHYGIEGAESGANEQVDVMSYDQWQALGGHEPDTRQFGNQNVNSPLYRTFNQQLAPILAERLGQRDIICLPFGEGHGQAVRHFKQTKVELGIGYKEITSWAYHIYESYAWMHWHLGKTDRQGSDYEWVIPNYYDPKDWQRGDGNGGYLLYFGRLNQDKGLDVVVAIAKAMPDRQVILCGQGDAKPWLTQPNIEYKSPIHGAGRDKLLGDASVLLVPSRYVEPFGSVAAEAQLCGTPVLCSPFGGPAEVVRDGVTGYHCHTLADWLDGVEATEGLDRKAIRMRARVKFGTGSIGPMYDRVFRQLDDLWADGWYTQRAMEATT